MNAAQPLLLGKWTDASLTDKLLESTRKTSRGLRLALLATGAGTLVLFAAIFYSILTGVGVWGNNVPVAWAFPIINFVWWIGIGHAGTFISAVLLLLEQKWRTQLNRLAEAMTLFALVQAGIFPLLHLGRPWFFYWLVPYPATMQAWPQFLSVLTWDIAAVSTYLTISICFWYLGLVPDLAVARDRAEGAKRKVYAVFALGWRGSARHYRHFRSAHLLLAGLATPLVLSVHSVVSMDFATAKSPGWHSLIFPPYFVVGAIYSGFAMVITIAIPIRKLYRLESIITPRHLDLLGKMTLLTGLILAYGYLVEHFVAWNAGNEYERWMFFSTRATGPYAGYYWLMWICNVLAVLPLWFRVVRQTPIFLFTISILVQIGMWLERFIIIVTSQHQDFLPSSWGMYKPSLIDGAIFFGTLSFFFFLILLLVRFIPFISISETKEMRHHMAHRFVEAGAEAKGAHV